MKDARGLLHRIQTQQATPEEIEEGLRLNKALAAYETNQPSGEDQTLLKAYGLIATEPEPTPAAEPPAAPPAAPPATPAGGPAGDPLSKALGGLTEGPQDPPQVGDLMNAIADAGGTPARQAVDVTPVLQAVVGGSDRMAKAMDEQTVATLAQNHLLAQAVSEMQSLRGMLAAVSTEQAELRKAFDGAGNPQQRILKALGDSVGDEMAQRLRAVEETMNNRPWSGNPPRSESGGSDLSKAMGGNDIGYYAAIKAIQDSSLPNHEKHEALGTVQIAISQGRAFADVLKSYGLLEETLSKLGGRR